MLTVGDIVRVICVPNEGVVADELELAALQAKYVGKLGLITQVSGRLCSWSVGESVRDPFVTLRFVGGDCDGFWSEELELVRKIGMVP